MSRPGGPARGPLTVLGAGTALVLVALTFGAATLLVTGVGLVVLAAVSPLLAVAGALSLRVERSLSRARVQEGEALEAAVTVHRRAPFALRAILRDPLAGSIAIPVIVRERSLTLQLRTSFPRRGRVHLDPTRLTVSDPLSLSSLVRRGRGPDEVLVLPAVLPVDWRRPAGHGRRLAETEQPGHEPPAALEVDGVRPYRPGTPASRIHWAALARGAGLMERRLRADGDELPLVLLDPASPAGPDELDAAVRAAASLALDLARRGGCRVQVGGQARPVNLHRDLAGWEEIHAALALVEAEPGRPPGGLSASGGGLLLLICAAWPHSPGPAARTLVVVPRQVVAPELPVRLSVAGCVGVEARGGASVAA